VTLFQIKLHKLPFIGGAFEPPVSVQAVAYAAVAAALGDGNAPIRCQDGVVDNNEIIYAHELVKASEVKKD
jgi:hypothetical protein